MLLSRGSNAPLATQGENAHPCLRSGAGDKAWVTLPTSGHVVNVEDRHAAAWVGVATGFLGRPHAPASP